MAEVEIRAVSKAFKKAQAVSVQLRVCGHLVER